MEVKAYFDKDTRRYHRFLIDQEEIKGTLYFSRDGEAVPDEVTIKLETRKQKTNTNY
ncbi:MAG: hypothetical protein ACFFCW_24085 [Candidatus Hodarchaeota archaeon]